MSNYRVISSDSHIFEPADLWTSRIEPEFRDRAPKVVQMEDGDWWYCDGRRAVGMVFGVNAGTRFEDTDQVSLAGRFEDVIPGGYIPEEHIKDMDIDGVDAEVLFPSNAFKLYNAVQDGELLAACFRVYNDWIAEFCGSFPDRLKGVGMLDVEDIQVAVTELERCAKLGLAGAMIPVFPQLYPHEGRRYYSPEYEVLWATAQDLEMPLILHILTNRRSFDEAIHDPHSGAISAGGDASPSFSANHDHWVRMSLGDIIFGGVLERYPKLQVGAAEFELSWVPYFLDRIDYTYTQRGVEFQVGERFKNDMLPSDFFHRQVFVSFQEDGLGIRLRDIIGVDNLQWASDYPHPESTFPRSREILEEILSDCTEEEKAKIAGGNTARVYQID